MASQPLAIKLRCTSWGQVAAIHDRDLQRGKLFLKTQAAIPPGREVRVDLVLPSGTVATLEGRVAHVIPPGERGPGVELVLTKIPPSTLYLIESALKTSAAAPVDGDPMPTEETSTSAAERDLVSALEEELQGLRQMNPFQVLAVPSDTSDEAVRQSFIELSKKYHPDLFARFESERGRQLASDIFVTIRDSYRKIADTAGRTMVRSQLSRGPRRDLTPIFGVPAAEASTPVMGVPIPVERPAERPAERPGERPRSSQPPPKHLAATSAREPLANRDPPGQRQGTPIHGVPILQPGQPTRGPAAPRREGTPVQGVPVAGRPERPPARREGTPVQGVAIPPSPGQPSRGQPTQPPRASPTPVPQTRREPTPVQGVPAGASRSAPPIPRRETPVRGVPPRRPGTPIHGVPIRERERPDPEPDAPEHIDMETSAPTIAASAVPRRAPPPPPGPSTRVAPAVPPPPSRPSMAGTPIVTFKGGGSEEPPGPPGLDIDDLFRDIGDLPRASHAMSPINLEEKAETRAASELVDIGRYEEAISAYDEQLRRNPTDRSARAGKELAFGLKLAVAGDRQGAIQHLEAALEIEPWSERTARALNGIRRAQTDSRKGLLSKLLGRGT